MALQSINGPARVNNPKGAQAVRNPIYDANGKLIGSGSTPGANDLDISNRNVDGYAPGTQPGTPSTPVPGGGTNPGNPVGVGNNRQGRRNTVNRQAAIMNRRDPRQNMSLTAEELRKAALQRLRGE